MSPLCKPNQKCFMTHPTAMNIRIALLFLALAGSGGRAVYATPLDDLRTATVSAAEFGSFRLEYALNGIKDWPTPVDGAGVSLRIDPDRIDIVIAAKKVPPESFRTACAKAVARVREFLYVNADGVAPMGRSYLISYFHGTWRANAREIASRALDASTNIRVNVVGVGSCQAALIKTPVTFDNAAPK